MKRLVGVALSLAFVLVINSLFGMEILNNTYGARPMSLGGAYVAVGGDPDAVLWNPGGIPSADYGRLSITYQNRLGDFQYIESYGVIKIPQKVFTFMPFDSYLGIGFVFWGTEEEGYNDFNELLPTKILADQWLLGLGYKIEFGGILSAGITFKYANRNIDNSYDSAFVFDIGAVASIEGVGIGLLVKNIGFGGTNTTLPIGMSLGGYYTFFRTEDNQHTIAGTVQLDSTIGSGFNLRFGAEYCWFGSGLWDGIIKARMGYDTTSSKDLGALAGYSFGLGVSFVGITANYTFSSVGLLGLNHEVNLVCDIDYYFKQNEIANDKKPPIVMTVLGDKRLIVMGEKNYALAEASILVTDDVGLDRVVLKIVDVNGNALKTYFANGLMGAKEWKKTFDWDGTMNGSFVGDGAYSVQVLAYDLKKNETKETKSGIVVSSDLYSVALTIDKDTIISLEDKLVFSLLRKPEQKLKYWILSVFDEEGSVIYRVGEQAKKDKGVLAPIQFVSSEWNGTDSKGNYVGNGSYTANLTVEYEDGTKRTSFPVTIVVNRE